MFHLHHLYLHIRKYGFSHKTLYIVSVMIFCWAVFDAVISYLVPIVLVSHGLSKTMMGVVLGSSSIAGALFDIGLAKLLHNMHYRRLYLLMFITAALLPYFLWRGSTLTFYLIAMALWGLYYDLMNFGNFDFVSRESTGEEHAPSFGVIQGFKALGYLIGPIGSGLLIATAIDWQPFLFGLIFLGLGFAVYGLLLWSTRRKKRDLLGSQSMRMINWYTELRLWKKIGIRILPVLLLTMFLNIADAFFWTIGPLFAEGLKTLHPFGGLFMALYTFPPLLVGFLVGSVTTKWGKKRAAYGMCFIASLFLMLIPLVSAWWWVLGIVFLYGFCIAVAWPAMRGVYVDFIAEKPVVESEIQGLADFSTNIGYVIGPILSGMLADSVGINQSFMVLGVIGLILIPILFLTTPRNIRVSATA